MEDKDSSSSEDLFLGLVGAVGSDLRELSTVISSELLEYNYNTEIIKLTDILPTIFTGVKYSNKYDSESDRINSYMDFGNKVREKSGKNDILVRHAMAKISDLRQTNPDLKRRAYIFHSLKHHEEVKL